MANTQEPTMEEILASIRRIISEDGEEPKPAQAPAVKAAPAPAAPAVPAAAARAAPILEPEHEEVEEEVLELTDIVPDEEPPKPAEEDVVMVERPAERPVAPRLRVEEHRQLISDRVRDQASHSFMQLARNVLVSETSDPRTLEHLVQEILRPMLQAWLNENLPSMVEGMVQQEIERVTRRERH